MRLRKPILVDSVATALKEIFVHVLLFSQAHVKSAPTERPSITSSSAYMYSIYYV